MSTLITIRDKATGDIETRSDGSPLEFETVRQAEGFLGDYFPYGTREVAEIRGGPVMGALILALLVAHRRRILDLAVGATFIAVSLLMLAFLPLAAACSLWALLIVLAVTGMQVRHGAGGQDPRFEAEEAARRAAGRAL